MVGIKMKTVLVAVALFFTALSLSAQTDREKTSTDYNALLVQALEGYRDLLSVKLDDDMEDLASQSWNLVARAISKGYLRFTVDPRATGFLNSAIFNAVPGKDLTYIIVSRELLDLLDEFPSTVYTMLSAAVEEAATFFQDPPAWAAARTDLLERLLLRVNNYTAQAQLIEKRLIPGAYVLSNYDSYIVDSYNTDALISVVLFLERHSLPLAQGLYQIRLKFEEDADDNLMRSSIVTLGENLLEKLEELPDIQDNRAKYPLLIDIHSWLEFTPEMMARIHNRTRADNPLDFETILQKEEDYQRIRSHLERIHTEEMPLILEVAEEINRNFIISKL